MKSLFSGPIHLLNTHIGALYSHAGLDAALSFMLQLFQSCIPVQRIQCSIRDSNTLNEFQNVAGIPPVQGTAKGIQQMIRYTRELYKTPQGESVLVLSRNPGPNSIAVTLRKHTAEARALLVVPLFTQDALSGTFYLAADNDEVFDRALGHFAYAITRNFAELLEQNALHTGQCAGAEYPPKPSSALEMLKMCPDLGELMCIAARIARTDSTILICGETGTGKEVLADAIHSLSDRKSGPFVKVNCGSIPESLLESELFGHEKGAFTGAESSRAGYFEQSQNGTILLDEIGELPLHAQAHLLRVLERKEIQRIGGTRRIAVNTRVLAATHRDLQSMVQDGSFREDLWYRLHVFPLSIPPLCERRRDLNILIPYFMARIVKALNLGTVPELSPAEHAQLCSYSWPGNVRELEHALERALLYASATHTRRSFDFLNEKTQKEKQDEKAKSPHPTEDSNPNHFRRISQKMLALLDSTGAQSTLPNLEQLGDAYIQSLMACGHTSMHGENGLADILQIHVNTLRPRLIKLGMYTAGKRGRKKREEE